MLKNFSAVLTYRSQLEDLLNSFTSLFLESSGLTLARNLYHCIVLTQGTDPIVVRPYRYPYAQKGEIENQCWDMLAKGMIRPSSSRLSSPVLLVKKSDNLWRFCVTIVPSTHAQSRTNSQSQLLMSSGTSCTEQNSSLNWIYMLGITKF